MRRFAILASVTALAACNLAPTYERPAAPVPPAWPSGASYPAPVSADNAGLPWTALVGDQRLRAIIDRALTNNRDLRVTLSNLLAARAQYRIQRAAQLPTVTADTSATFRTWRTPPDATEDRRCRALRRADAGESSW